jgi:hypothetical protein
MLRLSKWLFVALTMLVLVAPSLLLGSRTAMAAAPLMIAAQQAQPLRVLVKPCLLLAGRRGIICAGDILPTAASSVGVKPMAATTPSRVSPLSPPGLAPSVEIPPPRIAG